MADSPRLSQTQFRLLGFFPFFFFLAQGMHYWQINQLGHMLWMCNIGNLLLATGLWLNDARIVRVAVLWMFPGVGVWFIYVVPTWGMLITGKFTYTELFGVVSSTLAHLGGFSVGMLALQRMRMDRLSWLYAFAWYFVLELVCRLITPPALNVNLAHSIQPGWEQTFNQYWKFWLVLTLLVGLCLWLLGMALQKLWPAAPPQIQPEVLVS